MVFLTQYGPVLDYTIAVAKELTQYGKAEVRVPLHQEAVGLATDLWSSLIRLDQYIDSYIFAPGGLPSTVLGPGKDTDVEHRKVLFIFEKGQFEMPSPDKFAPYPYTSIIDLDRNTVPEEKTIEMTQNSITAKNTPEGYSVERANFFIGILERAGIETPEQRNLITLFLAYQSISKLNINTFFQYFESVGEFERKQVDIGDIGGHYFPVSAESEHKLDYTSWDFFNAPVFWDSWSEYSSIALNKMAGTKSYEEAARQYSHDLEDVLRHTVNAERTMVHLIQTLREGGRPQDIADKIECPPKFRGFYLSKTLKTLRWFCNRSSLNDSRRQYLENLAAAVSEHGFTVTAEELAELS